MPDTNASITNTKENLERHVEIARAPDSDALVTVTSTHPSHCSHASRFPLSIADVGIHPIGIC